MEQNKQIDKEYRSYWEPKNEIHCQIAQYTQIVIKLTVEARNIFVNVRVNESKEAIVG